MLRTTAHEQLRRTNPAKGYVAGRCNASTVAVTSDLGARPDKARLLHPPLWDLSFQTFAEHGVTARGLQCPRELRQLT
jgi:hypothetical protein